MLRLFTLLAITSVTFAGPPAILTRYQAERTPGDGRFLTQFKPLEWDGAKTAVILCDLWDKHGCASAQARVAELAPRVNEFIIAARKRGAFIIHCPSDCMAFYRDTPQRKLAKGAPKVVPAVPLERWCKLDAAKEGKLPIDDSDSGCEEEPTSKNPWTRQHPAIEIADGDAITDNEEAYYLLRQRGIDTVLIAGVHTNRCVLGRPFGIRQLVKQGFKVCLVRDLTDSLYNPKAAPFVSHFTGSDLVVDHVEKHWCPTMTSGDLLDNKEFRFKDDKRPTIVMLIGEDEYKTEKSLPEFALKHLGLDFRVRYALIESHRMVGIEQLNNADLLLLSMRRQALEKEHLDLVKSHISSGRPMVAIRTSSHAFVRNKGPRLPRSVLEWPEFGKEVIGCNYTGHDRNLSTQVNAAKPGHPILKDFPAEGYVSKTTLYTSNPLAEDCTVLLSGKGRFGSAEQPVAWLREKAAGRGRIFYVALGGVDDFAEEAFVKMLANACRWAVSK